MAFEDDRQQTLWRHVENFTPRFLAAHADGAVVRASCTLKDSEAVMASFRGPAVARAGSGVCYGYFERAARRRGLAGRQRASADGRPSSNSAPDDAQANAGPVARRRAAILKSCSGSSICLTRGTC